MRGREEIAFCEVDKFLVIDEKTVSFQMKRDYKSCKLDAQYNVIHKPAWAIVGERYVQILKMLKEKRKPGGKHNHRLSLSLYQLLLNTVPLFGRIPQLGKIQFLRLFRFTLSSCLLPSIHSFWIALISLTLHSENIMLKDWMMQGLL